MKLTKATHVMAVMSGNFVQRGMPAFTDKWVRTKMALDCGVNLVVELPAFFAFQDAGGFASGAVHLLDRTGLCDYLVFGSESGNIELLKETARVLVENEYTLSEIEEKYMKMGFSHPNARKYALNDLLEQSGKKGVLDILASSNDILGLEYLKALKKIRSRMQALCIHRIGSDYHNEEMLDNLSSATAIRKEYLNGDISNIQSNVPKKVWDILKDKNFKQVTPNIGDFETTLLNKFRALTRDHIKRYYGFTEGLDLRFSEFSMKAKRLDELLLAVKTKRFTYTRLQRLLLYFLFELTTAEVKQAQEYGPQYIRVLGFDEKGREWLAEMKKTATLPIISTPSNYHKTYMKYEQAFDDTIEKPYYSTYEIFKRHIQFDFRVSDYYTCLQWGFLPDTEMDIKKKPISISI